MYAHMSSRLRFSVATTLALAAATASAQSASPAPRDSSSLEEITVTAGRISESLQKVPISVTALSASDLADRQIVNTLDIVGQVPNLVGSNNVGLGTATSFFLRGVGQDESISTSDPAVGVYVDGVYIARQIANNALLYDVDRVEVLRGPQGTLYGRNTSGGAVKIITKKPGPDFGGYVDAGYEFEYNRYSVDGTLNVPFTDTLFGKLSAVSMKQSDGFIKNTFTGQEAWKPETNGARAQLRWLPSDRVDITGTVEYVKDQGEEVIGSDPNDRANSGQSLFKVSSGLDHQFAEAETKAFTLNADFTFDAFKLESITGLREVDQRFFTDLSDKAPIPFYTIPHAGTYKQFSQEFTFSGTAGQFDWLAGVFYMREENQSYIGDQLYLFGGEVAGNFFRDLANDTDSYAGFAQVTWHPIEALGITLGGRYTDERKTVDVHEFVVLPSEIPGVTVPDYAPHDYPGARGYLLPWYDTSTVAANGTDVRPTYSKFTPKVGVDYQLNPDVMLFASYTEGFKSGGWNSRVTDAKDFLNVKPEYVKSTELGIKSQWFEDRLRANVALYHAQYDDFIVTAINPATGGFVTINAAGMRSQGVEGEFTWNVTNNFNMFLNVGTIDAKYTKLASTVTFPKSNDVKRTPKLTSTLGVNGNIPVGSGAIVGTATWSHQDEYYANAENSPAGLAPSTDLLDASVGYRPEAGNWQVNLSCKNCTDKQYFHSALDFGSLGFATQYQGLPRQVFLNLRYDFGARK
jgi:iron complex outermembrane recepter protein